jgi:ubiquitin-conjugating enzyme E2 J1
MKDVWDSCREHGIEVDIDIAGGTSDAQTGAETQASVQTQDESPVIGNENPEPVQREATSHENVIPVAPVQAPEQVPLPAIIPTQNIPIQLPMVESPSESVWLDRAIIGVVIALVLLILRRVSNVDDL